MKKSQGGRYPLGFQSAGCDRLLVDHLEVHQRRLPGQVGVVHERGIVAALAVDGGGRQEGHFGDEAEVQRIVAVTEFCLHVSTKDRWRRAQCDRFGERDQYFDPFDGSVRQDDHLLLHLVNCDDKGGIRPDGHGIVASPILEVEGTGKVRPSISDSSPPSPPMILVGVIPKFMQ